MRRTGRTGRRGRGLTAATFLVVGCLLFTAAAERSSEGPRRPFRRRASHTVNLAKNAEGEQPGRSLQEQTSAPVDGDGSVPTPAPQDQGTQVSPTETPTDSQSGADPTPVPEGTAPPMEGTLPPVEGDAGTASPVDGDRVVTPSPVEVGGVTPAPVEVGGVTPAPVDIEGGTPAPVDVEGGTPPPADGDRVVTPSPVQGGGTTPAPVDVEGGTSAPVDVEGDTPPPVDGDRVVTPSPVEVGGVTLVPVQGTLAPIAVEGTTPPPREQDAGTLFPVGGGVTPAPVDVEGTTSPREEDAGTLFPVDGGGVATPSPVDIEGGTPEPVEGTTPAPVEVEQPTLLTTDQPVTPPPYEPSTCSNGIPGVQNGKVCCKESCGVCGGVGCGSIPGTNGSSDCCPSNIEAEAGNCGVAPCIIAEYTPAPTDVPATPAPYAPSMCSNGIAGVDNGQGVCCKENCGFCGGTGCGAVQGTNGASDCCPDTIIENSGGAYCGQAPCVMEGYTPSPANPAFSGTASPVAPSTCSNGMPGYQDGEVCCVEACGQCGGDGCGTIPGTGGAANCCSSKVRESGVICGQPPCIIDGYTPAPAVVGGGTAAPVGSSTCSNGMAGFQDGPVCCAANCGQCGGMGCGSIIGTGGQSTCCSSIIEVEGQPCSVTGSSPCIIDDYTPAPVVPDYGSAAPVVPSICSNGLPGYQDLDVCCLEACGQCGGEGCGTIPGTGGNEFCCSSIIRESGQTCGEGVVAPCIIGDFTPSPVNPAFLGTAAPVQQTTCTNGLPGVQNGAACCALNCGQCGGPGCGTIPGTGGRSNCCASAVLDANQPCIVNGKQAPCVIEGYTPAPATLDGTLAPYVQSMCSNGMAGVQNGAACCSENCGTCGGIGCGTLPGTGGSDHCCASSVLQNNEICGLNGKQAPCVIEGYTPAPAGLPGTVAPFAPSSCPNGLAGVQDGAACCDMKCGQCGGLGCGTLPGTGGSDYCCSSAIIANGTACSVAGSAPCFMDDWSETPSPTILETVAPFEPSTCSNGMAGYQDGSVCCLEACGLCGGVGCGTVIGTRGQADCCPSSILQANQICGQGIVAPCVIPSTPAPTRAPAITPLPTPVPFISGNARDFAPGANAAHRPQVGGLLTSLLLVAIVYMAGAIV